MAGTIRIRRRLLISAVYSLPLFLFCGGGIEPSTPTGFGAWADDCSQMVVAVNQSDFDNRLFMNHSTNERCDLHLCDSTGNIIKTFFRGRQVGGAPSVIDSLEFNKSGGQIIIYTKRLGTGLVRKERLTLSDESIETIEEFPVWNCCGTLVTAYCNGKGIVWKYGATWIEVVE